MTALPSTLGVVVIGRNEGERLVRCLRSLGLGEGAQGSPSAPRVVYVDSGSTDGSVAAAAARGAIVVELDMGQPFTAARARNAGLEALRAAHPGVRWVQFVDGDCEVCPGWLVAGSAALAGDATIAAVSGRLRERFPQASIYNRLADLEWDRPAGEEKSCGGVAMMRVEAVERAGGFDATLIAGEEPELCARLRALGLRIVRLRDDMAWHDIAMTRFAQWQRRARRHGHAIVDVGRFRTPASRGLFALQERSVITWGIAWPATFVLACVGLALWELTSDGAAPWWVWALVLGKWISAWLLQALRITLQGRRRGLDWSGSFRYGVLLMGAKFAQGRGMIEAWRDHRTGVRKGAIDHKDPSPRAGASAPTPIRGE